MIDCYELIKEKIRANKAKYKMDLIDERYEEKTFGNFLLLFESKQSKGFIRFINDRGQLFVEIKNKKDWVDIYKYLNKKNSELLLNKEKMDEVFILLDLLFNKEF